MKTLAIRIGINAVALWVAAQVVAGMTLGEGIGTVLVVAIVFGLVNAFIKPLAKILTFPFILVTLGLFTLVINTVMLLITDALNAGLTIDGFGAAFLGSIVISLVSWGLSVALPDGD